MDLRARHLERTLSRRVRQAIAAAPTLAREYRRQRRPWWGTPTRLPDWVGGLFFATFAAAVWLRSIGDAERGPLGLLLLAVWGFVLVALQANRLADALFADRRLAVLLALPLGDDAVFQAQTGRFWRKSAILIACHLPAGIVLMSQAGPGWIARAAGLCLPVIQAAVAVALAIHLETRYPNGWHRYLMFLSIPLVVCLFAWEAFLPHLPALLQASWWLPPFGWLNYAYYYGAVQGDVWAATLVIPAAIPFWTLPWTWRRLRATYCLVVQDVGATDGEGAGDELAGATPELVAPGELAEIEEVVRAGPYLRPIPWWNFGWFERLVAGCLGPRGRLVTEFLTAGRPGWTRRFKTLVWLTGLGALLMVATYRLAAWSVLVWAAVVLAAAVPLLGGSWRGFGRTGSVAPSAPVFAMQPFGYWEMARVILLVNVLRCVVAVPFLAGVGALAGALLGSGWMGGLGLALRVGGLALVLQPVLVVFRFALSCGSTERVRLPAVLVLVPAFFLWIAAGAILFLVEPWAGVGGILALLMVAGLVALWAHQGLWARGKFDLLGASDTM